MNAGGREHCWLVACDVRVGAFEKTYFVTNW